MIDHRRFRALRMSDFVDPSMIISLCDWEFEGRICVGEALHFSEWLRPREHPDRLVSLSLDLRTFPEIEAVLGRLELPLRYGQLLDDVKQVLGSPVAAREWATDRHEYDFSYPLELPYQISCVFTLGEGLHYLVVRSSLQ